MTLKRSPLETFMKGTASVGRKRGKGSAQDRLKRSRERNRIHARKTRQRKKEHMQLLQQQADGLKEEQLRLKQLINEKTTARLLVGLLARSPPPPSSAPPPQDPKAVVTEDEEGNDEEHDEVDPLVERILTRPETEIPHAGHVSELPALILPGQHASRKLASVAADQQMAEAAEDASAAVNDGIDYDLLGKDRSLCTPAELDQIRRERNRMHAKRTRDRKRLFTEQMAEICRQLSAENALLRHHLRQLDPDCPDVPTVSAGSSSTGTPELHPMPSSCARGPCGQLGTLLQAAALKEDFGEGHRMSLLSNDGQEEAKQSPACARAATFSV